MIDGDSLTRSPENPSFLGKKKSSAKALLPLPLGLHQSSFGNRRQTPNEELRAGDAQLLAPVASAGRKTCTPPEAQSPIEKKYLID